MEKKTLYHKGNARSEDGNNLLFIIYEYDDNIQFYYRGAQCDGPNCPATIPAIKRNYKIAMIEWPSQKCLGKFIFYGDEPPESVSIQSGPGHITSEVYGDTLQPLSKWLESLPTNNT